LIKVLNNGQRGVTMLGLLALVALLAAWCAIILDRSVETYRASAMLEWRLQARAAAEGLCVLLRDDPARPLEPQSLATATVRGGEAVADGERRLFVPLEVSIAAPGGGEARYSARYRALFVRGDAGWRLLRLEE
jgi:hypothetical protein